MFTASKHVFLRGSTTKKKSENQPSPQQTDGRLRYSQKKRAVAVTESREKKTDKKTVDTRSQLRANQTRKKRPASSQITYAIHSGDLATENDRIFPTYYY